MKLKKLIIKNFRNFKNIEIELSNKNVIFGMNDTGKTNLLYALRFLLDRDIRKNGFLNTDFYKNDTSKKIEMILEIDISDRNLDDENSFSKNSKFLISKTKGARNSDENLDSFFIKLEANYDDNSLFGNPDMYWGSILENLENIPRIGETYEIDRIFKIMYVNPNTEDLQKIFKRNRKLLFDDKNNNENDAKLEKKIERSISEINENVSQLSVIKNIQDLLTENYKKYKLEELLIELKSEIVVNGFMDNLVPYIKWNDDENYYPTSGDGRKKILSYALNKIVTEKNYGNQIVIYLIEEPENSLHNSMQMMLSQQLFLQPVYNYFFLTTHSSKILYEMDETQLIRITNNSNSKSFSYLYKVPKEYKTLKKKLNKGLSESLFYNEVLLVEGASEYVLFEAVLLKVTPNYETLGKFLLQTDGINFKPYVELYKKLQIKYFIKTDNDLKSKKNKPYTYDLIGLNRCVELIDNENLNRIESIEFTVDKKDPKYKEELKKLKENIYRKYNKFVNKFKKNNIYLSEIDLENDLYKIIPKELNDYIRKIEGKEYVGEEKAVKWLQSSKLYNMIEFIKNTMNKDLAEKIKENTPVLKEFVDNGR